MNAEGPTTHSSVSQQMPLHLRLLELEEERDRLIRQRRRNLLFAGAAVSLLVHVTILWYLDSISRGGPGESAAQSVFVEFNTMPETELSELEEAELASETPESLSDLSELPETNPLLNLDVKPPSVELEVGEMGSMSTLGGGSAGGGSDMSLGGGGANTSFFGISSSGTRFCYIVDISGSMTGGGRFHRAMQELRRSIASLPDFAQFYVVLYHSSPVSPKWQSDEWNNARQVDVSRMFSWLDGVSPGGGTEPVPAFRIAFGLTDRPDVIFFLTDGQIPDNSDDRILQMNASGRGAVINTIAFGDARSQEALKRIATESGGLYRYVSSE